MFLTGYKSLITTLKSGYDLKRKHYFKRPYGFGESEVGYFYILYSLVENAYKIGITYNWESRWQNLRPHKPTAILRFRLNQNEPSECPEFIEDYLHDRIRHLKVKNKTDWYSLTHNQALALIGFIHENIWHEAAEFAEGSQQYLSLETPIPYKINWISF